MEPAYHTPVLLAETLAWLPTNPDGIYLDGTLGGGGHAEGLLHVLSSGGRIIGVDRDPDAVAFARERLGSYGPRVVIVNENAASLARVLREMEIASIDGALFDLGVSSHQIDEPERGFSFQRDGRIDMRMDARGGGADGRHVVNSYSAERLASVFRAFGEERAARRIAGEIVRAREAGPIETTGDLARIIGHAVYGNVLQKTLARVFQAIRIEVNDELGNLRKMLHGAVAALAPGGRIVVISYHSLEDRIVKEYFRDEAKTVIKAASKLAPDEPRQAAIRVVTKKPIVAGEEEQRVNPRSRSAKMRVAEKI